MAVKAKKAPKKAPKKKAEKAEKAEEIKPNQWYFLDRVKKSGDMRMLVPDGWLYRREGSQIPVHVPDKKVRYCSMFGCTLVTLVPQRRAYCVEHKAMMDKNPRHCVRCAMAYPAEEEGQQICRECEDSPWGTPL